MERHDDTGDDRVGLERRKGGDLTARASTSRHTPWLLNMVQPLKRQILSDEAEVVLIL